MDTTVEFEYGGIYMEESIQTAIELRNNGFYKKSNLLLVDLADQFPNNAQIHYQCAWSFDVLGEEAKAVPYYERAISLGLDHENLEGALLGLGSTYRTLGQYEKSAQTFQKAIQLFPSNKAIQVFFAMTLYNLEQHQESMELLLKCIIETTKDKQILAYSKAIEFYSDKLDEKWK